ncbi:MAG: PQQ-binding-like beta-propeller repeat protein [Planctomycetes bacterium]|nr:PQQ-binding-like beta-propeller repeat protein [Planctomycetota bacterium]
MWRRRGLKLGGIVALGCLVAWACGSFTRPSTAPAPTTPKPAAVQNPFLPDDVPDTGWPFVRGPRFDGHSPEIHLAEGWPESGPPVLWHRSLGQGYSSFVASADRVFTQYQTLSGQYVACLAADTGEPLWEYHYDWPFEAAGLYPGPRATPTLANDRIYFASPVGLVGCLSWEGQLLWQVDVRKTFNGKGTEFGYSCSPTVIDDLVLLPVGGQGASLVALDATDGTTRWTSGDAPASYVPAYPVEIQGRKLIIGYLQNTLTCFDQSAGEQIWRMELSNGYDEHAAWPILVDGKLWISAPFKSGSRLLDLTETSPEPATIWRSLQLSNDVFSSIYTQQALFGFDLRDVQAKLHRPSRGIFRCLDFATGESLWESAETGHCSVLAADGKLFLFNDQGDLIVARASRERYTELARCALLPGEIGWSAPALHRGRLYVRNQKFAACVYVGEPARFQSATPDRHITIADIPRQRYYDLAAWMGVEPEYAMDAPSRAWLKHWFLVGLALLALARLPALLMTACWPRLAPVTRACPDLRPLTWICGVVLGGCAMPVLSRWRGEFVFTWPVVLFVAFDAAVSHLQWDRTATRTRAAAWREKIVIGLFIAICLGYFALCRRLSLAFEWVFLAGFPAALPALLIRHWLYTSQRRSFLLSALLTVIGFAGFYWSAVALLWWKYPPVE